MRPDLAKSFVSLREPRYRWLWSGMMLMMSGWQIDMLIRPWLAYTLTDSAFMLGLVAISRGIAQLLVSLIAGAAADRFEKRLVLISSHGSLAVIGLVNAVLVHLNVITVWHLLVLGTLQGIAIPFSFPARQAYIPELVRAELLPNAIAVDSSGKNILRVVAPAIGGLLLLLDPTIAFYAIAFLFTVSAVTLLKVPPSPARGTAGGIFADLWAGCSYMWQRPTLRILLVVGTVPALLGMPYQQFLPVFQANVLHVGRFELGIMNAISGVGALLGSLLIARISDQHRLTILQAVGGTLFGAALAFFAFANVFGLSLALLFVIGMTSQGFFTINGVLLMLNTDRKYYGRVMGIYMMTFSAMPLATLPLGGIIDQVGAPITIGACGILLVITIVILSLVRPDRHARRLAAP